ncbi:glycosyltransferase [Comamonas sp.]|uniref:glycosyltransferase n=1 Tax=Comamonas sp. TaxID=34028 RepID=UPI00289676C9|nr:glycosyltransferase [Comamonas sp.]
MKTLTLVTTSYPVNADGSEAAGSFVADLVQMLSKHVFVRVVAPGPHAKQEVVSERITVHRFAAPSKPLSTLRPWKLADVLWTYRVLHGGMQATRQAAVGSDHIFALWALPSGEWARRTAVELGISYSVWMLGSDIWSLGRVPLLRRMLRKVIRQASHAYADGIKLALDAETIAERSIVFLPSTRAISAGTTPAPRPQGPYRLLFLGRWHPNKGIDLLLKALNLLTDAEWQHIQCVDIQGGGPMKALVQAEVGKLQAAGRPVVLGGFLAKEEAVQAIALSDWLLIPSRIESIPVVFSDAMKLGRPVLAMPVGDLPSLVAGHNLPQGKAQPCGLVAEQVSAYSYAQALRQLLVNEPSTFATGVQAQAQVFDLPSLTIQIQRELGFQDE